MKKISNQDETINQMAKYESELNVLKEEITKLKLKNERNDLEYTVKIIMHEIKVIQTQNKSLKLILSKG